MVHTVLPEGREDDAPLFSYDIFISIYASDILSVSLSTVQ
jgi:hypothetical protein